MNILLENNTVVSSGNPNPAFEDANSVGYNKRFVEHDNIYNNYRHFPEPSPDFNHAADVFKAARREAVSNTSAKDMEIMQKFHNFRGVAVLISIMVLELIFFLVAYSLDIGRTFAFLGSLVFMSIGIYVGNIIAKYRFGNSLPIAYNELHYNYRFTDNYILMTNEKDSKIMRYEHLRAAEAEDCFYIQFEGVNYTLSKAGFSKSCDEFKSIMEKKGVRVEVYIGQF